MTPDIPLTYSQPRTHPRWKRNSEGSGWDCVFLCELGTVEIFTYEGGRHGDEFTQLVTYVSDWRYETRLPKAYHERWLGRLASRFAYAAWHDARNAGRIRKDAWPN